MATEAGEVIVKISADIEELKTSMKQVADGASAMSATTVSKGIIMADVFKQVAQSVAQFAINSIKQFGEQEQAMVRLAALVGGDAAESFSKLADSISRTSTFTDNEIVAMQAQLAMFGLTVPQIKQATSVLVDYAAATGKTLPEAAGIMGQALAGNGRQLKQLGIEIFSTDTRGERFDRTMTGLKDTFDGMSAKIRDTTLGQFTALHNSFEQLEQQIGRLISGGSGVRNLTAAIDELTDALKKQTTIGGALKAGFIEIVTVGFLNMVNAIKPYIALWNQMVASMGNVGKIMGLFKLNIDGITGSIAKQILAWRQSTSTEAQSTAATVSGEKAKKAAIDDTTRSLDEYISALNHSILVAQAVNTKISEITHLETEKRMLDIKNSFEANASYSDQLKLKLADDMSKNTTAWVDMTTTMIDSFASSTAKMIVEGGKFSDIMRNLWTQLAEMIIQQIIRMIAEWLIWEAISGGAGGFAGGFLGHGAAGGMINEPSMVIGMRSGSAFVAGEAGPEAFGPAGTTNTLNGGAAASSGGGSGGGGGGGDVHVHITGQFIEGSPSKWQRLVQEQIAPQIRRLAMKDPNSLITRKRGSNS